MRKHKGNTVDLGRSEYIKVSHCSKEERKAEEMQEKTE